jgi:hypothetical protein
VSANASQVFNVVKLLRRHFQPTAKPDVGGQ